LKRSFSIAGHRTSLALEAEFWTALENWAAREGLSLPQLIGRIDAKRAQSHPLSSAVRVAILRQTQKTGA
jgi:predicted DNA-binding ribbon-helix-helix protein